MSEAMNLQDALLRQVLKERLPEMFGSAPT